MFCRFFSLACFICIILAIPAGSNAGAEFCHKLTRGLISLGAEKIAYQSYNIIESVREAEEILESVNEGQSREAFTQGTWTAVALTEEGPLIVSITGRSYDEVHEAARGLTGYQKLDEVWNIESFFPGDEDDMMGLAMALIINLGGTLQDAEDYNGAKNILAYVPWGARAIDIDGKMVNLNMEFYRLGENIRVRVGMPVLFTQEHYIRV